MVTRTRPSTAHDGRKDPIVADTLVNNFNFNADTLRRHRDAAFAIRNLATPLGLLVVLSAACGEQGKVAMSPKEYAFAGKSSASFVEFSSELSAAVVSAIDAPEIENVAVGESVEGRLSAGDAETVRGNYFDAWTFQLDRSSVVRLEMRSTDVDAWIGLFRGSQATYGESLGMDDDGGEGTDASLGITLDPGTYTAMATSYAPGEVGAYEFLVVLDEEFMALGVGGVAEGSLDASDESLPAGERFEEWTYTGRVGESLTITMSSNEVDSYLMVSDPESGHTIAFDDDGGGGRDAAVEFTLAYTGRYSVIATSYGPDDLGAYTLTVEGNETATTLETGGDPNERYALLVGIDDYPGSGSDLRGPVNDVSLIHEVLTNRFGFAEKNIVTLLDEQATRANVANGIVQHLGQAGPDGAAVFFFSGHGTQMGKNVGIGPPLDPEPRGQGDEALVVHGSNRASSILLDEELGYLIESIGAGRSLVLVDACFSGQITRGPANYPQSKAIPLGDAEFAESLRLPKNFIGFEVGGNAITDMSTGFGDLSAVAEVLRASPRHVMWSSSTEDQVSWTTGRNSSVFTQFVAERLMAAPLDRSLTEVAGAVTADVVEYINRRENMSMQDPVITGADAGLSLRELLGAGR